MATTSAMRSTLGRTLVRHSPQRQQWQHVQRTLLHTAVYAPPVPVRRLYSTTPPPPPPPSQPPLPPQQQPTKTQHAAKILGGPARQFIFIISGMSRFVLKIAAGILLVGVSAYEGTHQYIEHIAMPKGQLGGGVLDGTNVDSKDAWGWLHDYTEETWVGRNKTGTDTRLGFGGRHQVRSAWSAFTWGGGMQAMSRMGGTSSLGSRSASSSSVVFYEDEGTRTAERLLFSALLTAEKKGIRLPDMAAIRAGLPAGQRASANQSIDQTAVMLEYRLAAIRERVGGTVALRGALAGYTRLYDALASLSATNRAMHSEGNESGQPGIQSDRLVRLATKVGDLHNLLGNRADAERWLLQAVELAGGGGELDGGDRLKVGATSELAHTRTEVQGVRTVSRGTSTTPLDSLPSPSLTRSLISSLLSLSAFHAQPSDQSALEQALRYQASALRLTRVEMDRWELSRDKDDIGGQLHNLWLQHHDGLACVHIGETMYGIRAATKAHSSSGLLSTLGLRSGGGADAAASKHEQTLAWLQEARVRADNVVAKLAAQADTRRPEDALALSKKWANATVDVQTQARRLLRDAHRLQNATREMTAILTKTTTNK